MVRHSAPRPHNAFRLMPFPLRAAAAAMAALGLIGSLLAVAAWTHPVTRAGTATSASTRSVTFSYRARVPVIAAYDGDSVTFPSPVFRRLASSVSVTYTYAGAPAQLTVTGTLSASNGWHTTVPLAARTTRSGGQVELDLKMLDSRAAAAAKATGLSMSPLAFKVVATTHSAGLKDFTAAFPLALTPLTLSPTTERPTTESPTTESTGSHLVVSESSTLRRPHAVPTTLQLAGQRVSVATLRDLAALVLLLAAAGASFVLLRMRRIASTRSEGERIRHRYAALRVPVHPVTSPPGPAVIDVTDIATLAHLAGRYGLLILDWSRDGIDTFIVQDGSTTYRYRTCAPPARTGAGRAVPAHQL